MLSEEERSRLEQDRTAAKECCREIWSELLVLRARVKELERKHWEWSRVHAAADRMLAEEDKLQVVKKGQSQAPVMTKDQILELAEKLGVRVEFKV